MYTYGLISLMRAYLLYSPLLLSLLYPSVSDAAEKSRREFMNCSKHPAQYFERHKSK